MLIDRTHRTWFLLSAALLAIGTVLYAWYALTAPNGPKGGSLPGLLFGIAGSAMMLFAGLLAGRKRVPTWRIGGARFWLRGHIWLGLLSVPYLLFHSGFGWGGLLENWLWITFGIVVVSGVFGLAVQQILPRLLTASVPLETFIDQIPYLCRRMQFLADKLVVEKCGTLSLAGDPLLPVFTKVVEFGRTAAREEKDEWVRLVEEPWCGVLKGVARHAKQEGWIRTEGDFPKLLEEMYADLAPAVAPMKLPAVAAAEVEENQLAPAVKSPAALKEVRAKGATKPQAVAAAITAKPAASEAARSAASPSATTVAAVARSTPPKPKPSPAGKPKPGPAAKKSDVKSKSVPRIEVLRAFYVDEVRPYLGEPARGGAMRDAVAASRLLQQMRGDLPAELHPLLEQLGRFCEERRQFEAQRRTHRWLHSWLLMHVPVSIALLVLFVAHVVTALRVVPF